LTKAAEAKLKAKEKAKKKKGKNDDKDEDDVDSEDDAYNALSKSLWSNKGSKPPVGSFEHCARCEKQFTVVSLSYVVIVRDSPFVVDEIHYGCEPRSWIPLSPVRESIGFRSLQETFTQEEEGPR
jgi:hypothetical protein